MSIPSAWIVKIGTSAHSRRIGGLDMLARLYEQNWEEHTSATLLGLDHEIPICRREEPLSSADDHRLELTVRTLAPIVDTKDRTRSKMKRYKICILTCRSTLVRLTGASLCLSVLISDTEEVDVRGVPHQLGLMSSIDDNTIYPAGITKLGTSQEHLIRSNGYFRRGRSRHGGRQMECSVISVKRRVGRLRHQVTTKHRDGMRIRQGRGRRMGLLDFQIGLAVEVGSLHIAQPFWLTTAKEDHVGWDEGIDIESDNISDAYPAPWSFVKALVSQDLRFVVVERFIGCVSFLLVR
jgi:hypothetical protein